MNYIHSLQQEIARLKAEKEFLLNGLDDLKSYVQSPKFASGDRLDGYVSTQDIVLRIGEIKGGYVSAGDSKDSVYHKVSP